MNIMKWLGIKKLIIIETEGVDDKGVKTVSSVMNDILVNTPNGETASIVLSKKVTIHEIWIWSK